MFCAKCGKELAEGSRFCNGCGNTVSANSNVEQSDEIIANVEHGESKNVKRSYKALSRLRIAEAVVWAVVTLVQVMLYSSDKLVSLLPMSVTTIIAGNIATILITVVLGLELSKGKCGKTNTFLCGFGLLFYGYQFTVGVTMVALFILFELVIALVIVSDRSKPETKKQNLIIATALCVAFMLLVLLLNVVYSKSEISVNNSVNTTTAKQDPYVELVKTGTLYAYPDQTIGSAFDRYIKNAKWNSDVTATGIRFVNVKGNIVYNDKEVEILIQFFVYGNEFQYNACELNGIPQNDWFLEYLLEEIYR